MIRADVMWVETGCRYRLDVQKDGPVVMAAKNHVTLLLITKPICRKHNVWTGCQTYYST